MRFVTHRLPGRFSLLLLFDALATTVALYAAAYLRFEGRVPPNWVEAVHAALPVLVVSRLAVLWASRMHRWSFFLSGLEEGVRLGIATFGGTVLFLAVHFGLAGQRLPLSVVVLELFLTTALLAAARYAPRVALVFFGERADSDWHRTIIVGAGSAGDLLLRDLRRSPEKKIKVVGFVDDDPHKWGTTLGGKPVVGSIDDLPRLVQANRVSLVLLAIMNMPAQRVRSILHLCSSSKARFKIIPASFTRMDERISAAMLHDLSPEDLLPRVAVDFDQEEIRPLVQGKRVVITGGAGSIGGEIARQVAGLGAGEIVLVDVNENDLYLGVRRLREEHPALAIRAEVADVREPGRLLRLGKRYRPHLVFHAAAHKHVPLMEDAPEEAVKNNVFGTIHAALMADAVGAERFVLISTDKAVRPSSVMGATKRIAELAVRDLGRKSRTRMTAVRFGNVLGSAGSVVPLFKQQIERGGPVTVTHPDCTRYFMTIPEAVGLVLVSALGDYGELCVLEMGEPVRIADLAHHLITMAGLIPNVEIPIVFVGLRAGEKLHEELMTEEEERTRRVRNRILSADSPRPPADLWERLGDLKRLAESGDQEPLLRAMRVLVPSYQPAPAREMSQPPEGVARGAEAAQVFPVPPARA